MDSRVKISIKKEKIDKYDAKFEKYQIKLREALAQLASLKCIYPEPSYNAIYQPMNTLGCNTINESNCCYMSSVIQCLAYTKVKEIINSKAELVDAYRLPNGVFETTDVLSDIVVFKKL